MTNPKVVASDLLALIRKGRITRSEAYASPIAVNGPDAHGVPPDRLADFAADVRQELSRLEIVEGQKANAIQSAADATAAAGRVLDKEGATERSRFSIDRAGVLDAEARKLHE